ncbi:MAG: hypothetical protein CMJ31_14125 [Phycisphaerae bacterium]|nr:hypothetical protein [Phycisphaerae bacterium]
MTSMIDVVFLLLIFFMVTANFSERENELRSTLATEGAGSESVLEPQIVDVGSGTGGRATFRIGDNAVGSRDELAAILELLPKEPGVIIRVSGDAPVWAAAAALQAAQSAGFDKRTYVPG